MQFLAFICTTIILLAGAIRFLISGILRLAHPHSGVKKDYNHQPTVSILLPCFNEGPAVYDTVKSILESDYPQGKLEVIVTDDCSQDDSWDWIEKAAIDFPNVIANRNISNVGKTKTVLNALERSTAEVVVIVDSDTLLSKQAIKELMACLADQRLGGVGGPCSIRNPNDNALTGFQVYLYYLSFHIGKAIESRVRTVGCVGGHLFAIRRELFERIRPLLEARRWFGAPCLDGEDRFITHQILLHGYGTYIDMTAAAWSTCPNTFKAYFGQQLRWRRSASRDFFYTLARIPQHMKDINLMGLYVYVLTPLVQFIAILDIFLLFASGLVSGVIFIRLIMFLAVTFFILVLSKEVYPGQALKNPLGLVVYFSWWVINNLLLVPLALFTLDSGSWGNREGTNQGIK